MTANLDLWQWWIDHDYVNAFLFPRLVRESGQLKYMTETADVRQTNGCSFMHITGQTPPERIVMYFHGNAEDFVSMHHSPFLVQLAESLNALVICPEFPGYSTRGNERSCESTLNNMARAAIGYALEKSLVLKLPLFVYGNSLGGAVAIEAVSSLDSKSQKKIKGMILQATFTCISAVAEHLCGSSWVSLFVANRFDSLSKLQMIHPDVRMLFIHGGRDTTVPIDHTLTLIAGRRMVRNSSSPTMMIDPLADHNTVSSSKIMAALRAFCCVSPH